jgi:hypothetical protein
MIDPLVLRKDTTVQVAARYQTGDSEAISATKLRSFFESELPEGKFS